MINLKRIIFLEQQIQMTSFIFIYYCVTHKVHVNCFWNIFNKHLGENVFQLSALKEDSVLYVKEALV